MSNEKKYLTMDVLGTNVFQTKVPFDKWIINNKPTDIKKEALPTPDMWRLSGKRDGIPFRKYMFKDFVLENRAM